MTLPSGFPRTSGRELIEPVVDGVLHRSLAKHTVREIFTDKRVEIQQDIEQELRTLLAKDGVLVRSLFIGNVDLPAQYRTGLEGLLAEELATEKMRFTLRAQGKAGHGEGARGGRRQDPAREGRRGRGVEEIIAAKAREEAMKHVLPLKEKEIEQRRLEAEARKVQKLKDAEGEAEARKHRVDCGGRFAAQAGGRRGVSHRGHRQGAEPRSWRASRR